MYSAGSWKFSVSRSNPVGVSSIVPHCDLLDRKPQSLEHVLESVMLHHSMRTSHNNWLGSRMFGLRSVCFQSMKAMSKGRDGECHE